MSTNVEGNPPSYLNSYDAGNDAGIDESKLPEGYKLNSWGQIVEDPNYEGVSDSAHRAQHVDEQEEHKATITW